MSVCKLFVQNLMKKCWLASGRVLASSEKKSFCQCHLTLLFCLMEITQLLNLAWLSVLALLILVH